MAEAGGVGSDDSDEPTDADEVRLRLKPILFVDDADVTGGLVLELEVAPVPEVVVAVTTLDEEAAVDTEAVEVGAVAAVEDGEPVGPCGHHGQL